MSGAPARRRSVLVVEDDFDIREALTQVLTDEGYDVVGATNGQEALAVLRARTDFSLILLDLMMPVMDGWQFRQEQRSDPRVSHIPVLVLSADTAVTRRAESLAASGYLRKPIQIDVLLSTIERHCP